MDNTSINLRHLLAGLSDLKEHVNNLYNSLKLNLGPEATFIREWCDLKRLQLDGEAGDEIEGDTLISDILQHCWAKGVDYVWHYRGQRFRLTPFKNGTDDGGFVIYCGDEHSLVNFAGVVRDSIDTGTPIWEAVIARLYGIADGYRDKDLHWGEGYGVDPKEAVRVPDVADDLTWKRAFDDAVAVKDPDGTLACADPCPEEVPVPEPAPLNFEKAFSDEVEISDNMEEAVEQMKQLGHCDIVFCPSPELLAAGYENAGYIRWYAIGPKGPCFLIDCRWDLRIPVKSSDGGGHCVHADRVNPDIQGDVEKVINWVQSEIKANYAKDEEPKPKPKKNWKEKRASEKDLIRAGGGPLPDGNTDMTDEQKEEYRRWKEKRLAEEDLKWKQSAESPQRYG